MSASSRLLVKGKLLLVSGRVEEAAAVLRAAVQADLQNEVAWLSYIEALPTWREKERVAAYFLRTNPHSPVAQRVLRDVQAGKQQGVIRTANVERPSLPAQPHEGGEKVKRRWVTLTAVALIIILLSPLAGLAVVNRWGQLQSWRELSQLKTQYNTLSNKYDGLQQAYVELRNLYDTLTVNYDFLRNEQTALLEKYNQQGKSLIALQQAHDQLLEDHAQLRANYDDLLGRYNVLIANYNELVERYNGLQETHRALVAEYNQLVSSAIRPPYIYIHGRSVDIVFVTTDQKIRRWSVGFESLENDLRRGYRARENPINQFITTITLTGEAGQRYRVVDLRAFVDSSPFGRVIPELYAASESDAAFIYEVWNIVTQLAIYSREIEETPRFPLETFLAGGGDCEDTAILFASMIKAAPVDWTIDLVYMDLFNPRSPTTVNHAVVYIDTGSSRYFIDTTSSEIPNPLQSFPEGIVGWHINVTK